MKFDIITIFPNIFDGFLSESLISRGQEPRRTKGGRGSDLKASEKKPIIKINIHNLRKWTKDKHQTVDDRPYGGGVGMVFKLEPIHRAVAALKSEKNQNLKTKNLKTRTILFSPRGNKFTQKDAERLAKYDQLILICGRYEGVDERIAKYVADEVISIGDYVLNGGEVAAMAVIETVSRMVPRFIAKEESAKKFDHPQYTRPEEFKVKNKKQAWKVPKVLLSGNHKKIAAWREERSRRASPKGRDE